MERGVHRVPPVLAQREPLRPEQPPHPHADGSCATKGQSWQWSPDTESLAAAGQVLNSQG